MAMSIDLSRSIDIYGLSMGAHTLFTGQREREGERERGGERGLERDKERERERERER
jgi:hypothetical protein